MHLLLSVLLLSAGCQPSETTVNALRPEISVVPASVDFGEQPILQAAPAELWIDNSGRVALEVSLAIEGDEEGVFVLDKAATSIAADDQWVVPLSFVPQTYLVYDAVLRIESDDEDTPLVEVPLTGEGVHAPMPDIEVDPLALDFETVETGSEQIAWLLVKNAGDDALQLGTLVQYGSGAFVLTTDPSGTSLSPGAEVPILVRYAPVHDEGDSGTLTIPSDDPDEPEITVQLLGNGGGDFEYPVAEIDCPGTSEPPEWVALDGSGSSDPGGNTPLEYLWTLADRPSGSQAELSDTITETTRLFTDVAGTFEVQLVVTNTQGVSSAPARCSIEAIPADDLHIELTWDTSGADLDLHLLEDGASFFEEPGDCNFCNPNPKWGASGTGDDPRLDLDDRGGYGPENINVESPASGDYHVKVHYFDEHGDSAVKATVRIYSYGVLADELSKTMKRNEVWDVGRVRWPAGTVGVETTALYAADVRSCW